MIDFEKNSYTVVKGLIEPDWCKTLYNYVGYSADRCGLKQKHDEEKYREAWDGTFQDKQCPGNYAHYGDPMMDSMMMAHGKKIEEVTGMTLAPSYTYYRMYLNGAILKRHKDRPSCEISATVCLDWDDSNCEERKPWSLCNLWKERQRKSISWTLKRCETYCRGRSGLTSLQGSLRYCIIPR